jgi:hypothetical protein
MTAHKSREQTRTGTPEALKTGHLVNGRLRSLRATVLLSETTVASGDTIALGKRPANSRYAGHRITAGVSLGAATLAIGVAGTAGKYRAAAVHTAVDTPTDVALAAQLAADPLAADEEMIATIATAALPTSEHYLVIETFYTYD